MAKQVSKDEKSQEASEGFSEAEKANERTRQRNKARENFENQDRWRAGSPRKINEMEAGDKIIASSLHELIKNFPVELKTWYGFPAYTKDGRSLLFPGFKRFDERFSTLGFGADAKLMKVSFGRLPMLLEWNDKVAAEVKG